MKKNKLILTSGNISLFVTAAILGLSGFSAKAQFWSGSPINTFTTGNAGIGIGVPAINAQLEIENVVYPSGPPPGPFLPVADVTGTKISRKSYRDPWSSPATPSNIFEIYEQWFDYATGVPMTNNDPRFIVTEAGFCAINKPVPHARLDVGGNVIVDAEITAGTDVIATNDVKAGHNLDVTNDASVGHNLSVTNDVSIGHELNVTGVLKCDEQIRGKSLIADDGDGSIWGSSIYFSGTIPDPYGGLLRPAHTVFSRTSYGDLKIYYLSDAPTLNKPGLGINISPAVKTGTTRYKLHVLGDAKVDDGDLDVTGNVSANSFITVSDKNFKKNIVPITNKTKDLFSIIPYEYNFKSDQFPNKNFNDKAHYGFIAQEVKEIFPDLVETIDSAGHIGVNYIEIIPLLLQTLKEEAGIVNSQGEQIELLKKEIQALKSKSTTGIKNENVVSASSSKLSQNVPNPFGRETKIGFEIHEHFTQAFIGIYNLNGQEIRKIQIQNGQSEITLNADQMEAGMYVYSLVVNNNLIDSKRMVITK